MADVETQRIEVDGNAEYSDEAYAESSAASSLTSIASELRRGIQENGRTYAAFGTHEYALPHHKYFLLLDDKYHLAPLSEGGVKNVLDIGIGNGLWCLDIAEKFPHTQVTGTDIAPVQPSWNPPNCSFVVEDCEQNWQFKRESFDLIHTRDCFASVRDWPRFMQQSFDPAAGSSLAASSPIQISDDGTLTEDAAYMELCRTTRAIGEAFGTPLDTPLKYRNLLKGGGFVNVHEQTIKIPTSEWPKDPRLKKIGALERVNVIEGAEGFVLRGLTQKLGKTREEMEAMLARLRKELTSNRVHAYAPFVVVYGQKPGTAITA